MAGVSVVVCTHGNREQPLERLVAALGWQTLPFELVIVVAAPSAGLRALVTRLSSRARVVEIAELNISRARNAGMAVAGGDVLVFIDDDAVPVEGDWLEHLTAPLRLDVASRLAAVGSTVIRGDSDVVEFAGGATSLSGFQRFDQEGPAQPPDGGRWIPRIPGGNCAISRRPLEAVGGFDEQFAYYLDETDLCVRLDAAGWRILYTPDAPIRHFAAPSVHGRAGQRHRFPVARSDAYFVLRHFPGSAWRRVLAALRQHPSKHFVREGRALLDRGELSLAGLVKFRLACWRGLAGGIWAGLTSRPRLGRRGPGWPVHDFRPFTSRRVLILDPDPSQTEAHDAGLRLGTWAATLQREFDAVAVALGSRRVAAGEAPSTWLLGLPPDTGSRDDAISWFPDGAIRQEANAPLRALRQLNLPAPDLVLWFGSADAGALLGVCLGTRISLAADPEAPLMDDASRPAALSWFGSLDGTSRLTAPGDLGARLADPRQGLATRGRAERIFQGGSVEGDWPTRVVAVARALERRLSDETNHGASASILSDPLAAQVALALLRHCVRYGDAHLALALGRAIADRLPAVDFRAEAEYHVANALRSLGRDREAVDIYEGIRDRGRRPGAARNLVGGACYHLAVTACANGAKERARQLLEECLRDVPEHGAARRLLGELQPIELQASSA